LSRINLFMLPDDYQCGNLNCLQSLVRDHRRRNQRQPVKTAPGEDPIRSSLFDDRPAGVSMSFVSDATGQDLARSIETAWYSALARADRKG
jgi:hypothetical protein